MVAKFLQGQSKVKAEKIVDLIYNHPEAIPKTACLNASLSASTVLCPDKEPMAQCLRIREWAVSLIAKIVSKEAEVTARPASVKLAVCSFRKVLATVKDKAPTFLRVLTAAAISPKNGDSRVGLICRAFF